MTQEAPPPGSGTLRFLAVSVDPRPGKEGTVYGTGHVTTYDASDHEYIKSLLLEGKAELLDGPKSSDLLLLPPA